MKSRRLAGVRGGGPMAHFAAYSQLTGHDRLVFRDTERSGGVAREAAQDGGGGIEDTVADTGGAPMARRASVAIDRPIPALALFEIVFRVQASDECDGLQAGAKGPVAWLELLGTSQRAGVRAGRLRSKFRGMTFSAGLCARII